MTTSPIEMPGRSIPVLSLPEAPLSDAKPFSALYEPRPSDAYAAPLDIALRLAREDLAIQQVANIHDREAMIRAAVVLEVRLRGLLAALDADNARTVRPLIELQGGAA
ncbi:hypothetical protein ACKI14_02255 [Streptomyces turgidiscabies]|uniref:hypothetical protein n=1 Tax=Streptomyces turgidiscabies TaxID=85558 RepID=UPI0038F7D85C